MAEEYFIYLEDTMGEVRTYMNSIGFKDIILKATELLENPRYNHENFPSLYYRVEEFSSGSSLEVRSRMVYGMQETENPGLRTICKGIFLLMKKNLKIARTTDTSGNPVNLEKLL